MQFPNKLKNLNAAYGNSVNISSASEIMNNNNLL